MNDHPDQESRNIREINAHEDLAWNETTAETEAREAEAEILAASERLGFEAREAAELLKGEKNHDQTQEKVSNAAPTSNPEARRKQAEHDAVQAILDKDRPDQRPEARQSDTPRTDYEATLTATGLYVMVNFARTLERELVTAVTHLARIEAGVKADAADLEKMRDGTKLTRAGVLEIIMEQKEQLATVTAERDTKAKVSVLTFAQSILHGDSEHSDWLWSAALAFVEGKQIPEVTGLGKVEAQQREIARLKEDANLWASRAGKSETDRDALAAKLAEVQKETEKLTKLADNIQAIAITLEKERDALAAKLKVEEVAHKSTVETLIWQENKTAELAAKLAEVSAVIQLACQSVGMQPNDNFQTLPCVITMKLAEATERARQLTKTLIFVRENALLGVHSHWDREGNHGQTCGICIKQREVADLIRKTLDNFAPRKEQQP